MVFLILLVKYANYLILFQKWLSALPLYNISQNFDDRMNLTLKTEKQEMNYLNYSYALWDRFIFHIAQVRNMLLNQATLPDWAIVPDCWSFWMINKQRVCYRLHSVYNLVHPDLGTWQQILNVVL